MPIATTQNIITGPLGEGFCLALIQQSINNEYLFYAEPEELARIDSLLIDIPSLMSGDGDVINALMLAALYRPLEIIFGSKLGDFVSQYSANELEQTKKRLGFAQPI